MSDETDDFDIDDDDLPRVSRWIPMVVVIGVLGGFVMLAWYAYHAGTQSVKDEDLPVVEADKAPVKEKPLDPGGMKFPNQDKTVFETFAGKAADQPPKVERVLPAPEEPMAKDTSTSDTTGYVNNDASKGKPEQVIGQEKKTEAAQQLSTDKSAAPETETYIAKPTPPTAMPNTKADVTLAKPEPVAAPVTTPAAAPAAPATPEAPKTETKAEAPKPEKKPPFEPKAAAAKSSAAGGAKIQLGSYRSDKEAMSAWNKISKQHSELAVKTPQVVKADLGSRGIYYRLRVGGFADAPNARLFCEKLVAKGQACILASE